jgi:hypothetical protein
MKKTYKCLMNSTSGRIYTLIEREESETATGQLVERGIIEEYTDEAREWDEAVALAASETTPEALVKAPEAPVKKKGSK